MPFKDTAKQRAAEKRYRQKNAVTVRAKDKARSISPERTSQLREYAREYRLRNTEALREKARAYNRRRLGISNASGETKSGQCEICDTFQNTLHYDHNHETGVFRGWLCGNCNRGLGVYRDDPAILDKAALYLRQRGVL